MINFVDNNVRRKVLVEGLVFHGYVLRQDTSEAKLSTDETYVIHECASCRREMSHIMLKMTLNTGQLINQPMN